VGCVLSRLLLAHFRAISVKWWHGIISAIVPRVVSLAAYAVKVWNPSDREHEAVSDFDGDGADLFEFLHGVLTGRKTNTLDQDKLQQALSVAKLDKDESRLTGFTGTG